MFWQPNKTIFTGPRKQRGNIVIGVGLPPTSMPNVTGGAGGDWTLIEQWETSAGDLASITAAFGGTTRGWGGLVWSPDGAILTLSNPNNDRVISFNCTTRFDPETAVQITNFGITNPQGLTMNSAGTKFYCNIVVGDEWAEYPCSGFVVQGNTKLSNVTKADVGFSGSQDGAAVFGPGVDYMLWNGPGAGLKNISLPGGNLDAWIDQNEFSTSIMSTLAIGTSPLTADEKLFLQGQGSPGLLFTTMDAPRDINSLVQAAAQPISPITFVRPKYTWFNPNDTSEVWCIGDQSGIKLCRLKTYAQF
jgi:hypothetical protein